jgi:hypothetical protein
MTVAHDFAVTRCASEQFVAAPERVRHQPIAKTDRTNISQITNDGYSAHHTLKVVKRQHQPNGAPETGSRGNFVWLCHKASHPAWRPFNVVHVSGFWPALSA